MVVMDGVEIVNDSPAPTVTVALLVWLLIHATMVMGSPLFTALIVTWSTAQLAESVENICLGPGVGIGVEITVRDGVGVGDATGVGVTLAAGAAVGDTIGVADSVELL
jgi:hypothetical protein